MVQAVAIEISFAAVLYDSLSADLSLMNSVVGALKAWTATRTQVAEAYINVTLSASSRRLQEQVGFIGSRRVQSSAGTTADITIHPDAGAVVTQIRDRLIADGDSVSAAVQAVVGIDTVVQGGNVGAISAVVDAPEVIWAPAISLTSSAPLINADAAWGVMVEMSFIAVLYESLSLSPTLLSSFQGALQNATALSVHVPDTHVTVTLSARVRMDGTFGTLATLVIQHDDDTTTTEIVTVLTAPQFTQTIVVAVQQVEGIASVVASGDVAAVTATISPDIVIMNGPPTTIAPSTTADGDEALTDMDSTSGLAPGLAVCIVVACIKALQDA